jgi:O-antigen/teichoic acid export membrane protein
VLSNLGIDNFGIYNVIGGTILMFAFINSSLAAAVQRFLTYELGREDFDKLKVIFATSKKIHQILALCLFVIVEFVGIWFLYYKMNIPPDRINAGFWVLQSSIFALMINILAVPYNASVIAHENFKMFAYTGILEVILKLLLAIAVGLASMDSLVVYSMGMSGIALLVYIIYRKYCFLKYDECRQKRNFNKGTFREMFSFAGWNFLGAFSQICKNQGVNVILNIFHGVAVNAAQGITGQVNAAVTGFVANFTVALNPQITKSYSSNDEVYFKKLIYTGTKISYMLMTIVALPIILEINYILHLWLKEVPHYTNIFVVLILVSSIVTSWTGPVSMAINATGRIKIYALMLSIINICVLPVSYLLLRIGFSPTVVYVMYVFAQILASLIVLYLSKRLLHLPVLYFIRNVIAPVSLILIIMTIVLFKLQSFFPESFFRLLGIAIFSTLILSMLYYLLVFSKDERKVVKTILVRAKNKIISEQINMNA